FDLVDCHRVRSGVITPPYREGGTISDHIDSCNPVSSPWCCPRWAGEKAQESWFDAHHEGYDADDEAGF
ncbi:UNVERIFIED_CONTAM: hypothetical protein NY603_40950, partial [Bacteroidetes bacterium 56_B9]